MPTLCRWLSIDVPTLNRLCKEMVRKHPIIRSICKSAEDNAVAYIQNGQPLPNNLAMMNISDERLKGASLVEMVSVD